LPVHSHQRASRRRRRHLPVLQLLLACLLPRERRWGFMAWLYAGGAYF
jgi:hypothetical protein